MVTRIETPAIIPPVTEPEAATAPEAITAKEPCGCQAKKRMERTVEKICINELRNSRLSTWVNIALLVMIIIFIIGFLKNIISK